MMRYGFWALGGMCRHMGFGGGLFMMFGGLLLIGLLIYGIVLLTGKKNSSQTGAHAAPTQDIGNAMNILNERYARGEIDEDEYARKKAELRK